MEVEKMKLRRHLHLSLLIFGVDCELEESCGRNVQEDLRNMLDELLQYHQYLREVKNEEDYEEFNSKFLKFFFSQI